MIKATVPHKVFNFPCGEMQVNLILHKAKTNFVDIEWEFENSGELVELMLLCNAIKEAHQVLGDLRMPYIPFSRQDRVANLGECFSLRVFTELLTSLGFGRILVCDPHSDVSTALLKINGSHNRLFVTEQHEIFAQMFKGKKDFWLIAPDSGALKKIYKLAAAVNCIDVVLCSKHRDTKSGEIMGTTIHHNDFKGEDCYIVDDICDGGRTFVEIAKILKQKSAGKIHLMVTHGFFTKGLEVFDGLIDHIYTRKGQIK